jgi:hypothetical protein
VTGPTNLPSPLTPADCDLQDFEFMPVMVRRLLKSETWSLGNGEERAAAIALWFESWHQVPAASLPDNDRLLKKLADTEKWGKVKEQALRGWLRCSDGRLYHPVVAEKALEAWVEKLLNSISGSTGNAKRWSVAIDTSADVSRLRAAVAMLRAINPKSKALNKKALLTIIAPQSPPDESGGGSGGGNPESGGESGGDSPSDRKGQGKGKGEGKGSSSEAKASGGEPPKARKPKTPAEEADAQLWREAKSLFVETEAAADLKTAGELLGAAASKYGKDVFREAARAMVAASPVAPHSYLIELCERAAGKRVSLNSQEALEAGNRAVADRFLASLEAPNATH